MVTILVSFLTLTSMTIAFVVVCVFVRAIAIFVVVAADYVCSHYTGF